MRGLGLVFFDRELPGFPKSRFRLPLRNQLFSIRIACSLQVCQCWQAVLRETLGIQLRILGHRLHHLTS